MPLFLSSNPSERVNAGVRRSFIHWKRFPLEVRGSAGPSGPGRRARVDPRPISPYGTTVSGDHGRSDGAAVGFREG